MEALSCADNIKPVDLYSSNRGANLCRQHTHKQCNTHTNTATHTQTLQHTHKHCKTHTNTATHCNTHTNTATHCNTHTNTATHCNTQQLLPPHTKKSVSALIATVAQQTLQHTATHRNLCRQHTHKHCNTMQHTATHCNTQQLDLRNQGTELFC